MHECLVQIIGSGSLYPVEDSFLVFSQLFLTDLAMPENHYKIFHGHFFGDVSEEGVTKILFHDLEQMGIELRHFKVEAIDFKHRLFIEQIVINA